MVVNGKSAFTTIQVATLSGQLVVHCLALDTGYWAKLVAEVVPKVLAMVLFKVMAKVMAMVR